MQQPEDGKFSKFLHNEAGKIEEQGSFGEMSEIFAHWQSIKSQYVWGKVCHRWQGGRGQWHHMTSDDINDDTNDACLECQGQKEGRPY